jgi:hypothetical protein
MAKQTVNLGTIADDGTGDTLRVGGDKINDNFDELYGMIDTDGTLAANSDAKIATQKAVKTAIATAVTGLLDFKGSTDCSANPNYPVASKGDYYLVSVAGKIGGASGIVVSVGDSYYATADNAGGTQAGVGTSWTVVEGNLGFAPVNKAGDTMTGDLIVPDEAYDATAWNASLEVPTKNAVRDKIESVIAGAGSVSDTVYGAGWNGDTTVAPSKNAVYDKIEAVIAGSGSFTAASTTEQLTGTDTAKGATSDSVAALWEQGADVASAGTTSLGEGGYFNITGTTTITDIDFATDKAGRKAWVKFAGILTLTHNASTLILPTGANITTAAGDTACFVSEGSDVVRCVAYNRASGAGLRSGTSFPGSPATGDRFFRTDRILEYFYDGTRWLSTQIITLFATLSSPANYTVTSANQYRTGFSKQGHADIYVEYISLSYILVGTGNWTVAYNWNANSPAAGGTIGSGITVATNVSGNHYYTETAIGSVLTAAADIDFTFTKNSGSATFFPMACITYRLVG